MGVGHRTAEPSVTIVRGAGRQPGSGGPTEPIGTSDASKKMLWNAVMGKRFMIKRSCVFF